MFFIKKKLYLLLFFLVVPFLANAQFFRTSNYWKQFRHEITAAVGASNFLGEVGGRDQIGSDFIYDLELPETKTTYSIGYRFYASRNTTVRLSYFYSTLSGDDKLTEEEYRKNRNLHFKSKIWELSALLEYHLIQEKVGHRYKIKKAKGMSSFAIGLYGFAGIGVFHFNPKAEYTPGQWVELQPLGTEGQGIAAGKDFYSRTSIALPYGFGLRYAISAKWRIGLELGIRKTFTDYIDDASTTYFNNDSIRTIRGDMAGDLADPNTWENDGLVADGIYKTGAGQQRGDPTDNDAYMFATFTINYKLMQKGKMQRKKLKRKRYHVPFF